ncbi:hypothetical protein F4821DRAFT_262854 [Hypoxylon rubiginosum]|uniref:Uncharacterized protein n=1 Tax=Hypoxylon rubiginosum TaxID=110542 RepID=A0ACC0CTM4_9PEZI|nr:hypothetical protein F4821DRAFT_262854 [Hypoxylon rubiginosum]
MDSSAGNVNYGRMAYTKALPFDLGFPTGQDGIFIWSAADGQRQDAFRRFLAAGETLRGAIDASHRRMYPGSFQVATTVAGTPGIRRQRPSARDQFVYANDRYKVAGQWFALPKLFKRREPRITSRYQRPGLDPVQAWTFKIIPKTAVINALVSLSLNPGFVDSDFIRIEYHKD